MLGIQRQEKEMASGLIELIMQSGKETNYHADENCQHKYLTGKAHRVVEIEARESNPTPFEQRVV